MSDRAVIANVRVFDGESLSEPRTVVIESGQIAADADGDGDERVEGDGATLLPGLIDAHVHLDSVDDLRQLGWWGVTTALDMGNASSEFVNSLRDRAGLPQIRTCGGPSASAPGSIQTTRMGFPQSSVVHGSDDAERFVADRVAAGADYIKIITEDPAVMGAAALDVETVAALVAAAHRAGLKTIAHATRRAAFRIAADGGVDVLTHVPLDAALDDGLTQTLAARGPELIPTLTKMQAGAAGAPDASEDVPRDVTSALYRAGVEVLAGTDAYMGAGPGIPVAYGTSLHDELELLVQAGLRPVDALRAATTLTAAYFQLTDRGAVAPGLRGDLVLVDGDPTVDISATRSIVAVWIAGQRVR